jgi:hypothetical protein
MQTLSLVPLSPSEVQRIKEWLKSPEALLFTESLRARAYIYTLEAGELLKDSVAKRNNQDLPAKARASEAGLMDFMIEEMERVATNDGLMVKLSQTPALEPVTEEPTE